MDEEEKKPAKKGRYLFAGLLLLAVGLLYTAKLAKWQIWSGDTWLKIADRSTTDTVEMSAARGEIIDRNGVGLAVNQTGYAIRFNGATMTSDTKNKTILTLIRLMSARGEKWTDELPISVDAKGNYQFISGRSSDVAYLKSKNFLNMNSYATAAQCMQALVQKYDCTGYSAQDTRNIISVRYNMTKTGFSVSLPYTFADSVSQNTVAVVSENSASMPGVETQVTAVRKYPDGTVMPHILGTVGAITEEEYETMKAKGYALNARVGQSGIEKAFESWLCGKTGETTVKFDTNGDLASEEVTKQPVSGSTVQLTIDSRLEKVINASLKKNVAAAHAYGLRNGTSADPKGADCVSGAAVVLNVKDFSVLAASTYPSYDQNQLSGSASYYSKLLNDSAKPLINRAFNSAFTPGSTFKPAVAIAGLQSGSITNSTVFDCTGVYVLGDMRLHCWDRSGHGPLTLESAIAQSCDVYFCNVGYRTGIATMNLYAQRLGLGVKTGIEIGESTGVLAGPAERKAAGGATWNVADSVQASIGQSDNMFTPLQLATYCATIANNGVRLKTHLVEKITDYSRTKTVYTTPATQVQNIGVSQQNINYVKAGMRETTRGSGTAAKVFSGYGIAVAGKTGTAQTGTGHSDNEVFIGFAPYDNPQIAIAVMLPHGSNSDFSLGVAKDVFDGYFYGKTVDTNGNIVTPSITTPASSSNG